MRRRDAELKQTVFSDAGRLPPVRDSNLDQVKPFILEQSSQTHRLIKLCVCVCVCVCVRESVSECVCI